MSARFRQLPFKHKLTLITMLASMVALLLAGGAFTAFEAVDFRRTMRADLARIAQMVGENSSAALSFRDPVSAQQTLRSLAADPHINGAAIYDVRGQLFASYVAPHKQVILNLPAPQPAGHVFTDRALDLFHTITLDGEAVGTLYLQSDLEAMHSRLARYMLIVAGVLIIASLGAFLLARTLHQAIAHPISDLCQVANVVAAGKNYSIRARQHADSGELSRLIEGFNEMLTQIQRRDAELQRAHELLEQRVERRTRQLQDEIGERQRSEKALREINQRYEIVTRATTDVVWDWDLAARTVTWNDNFETVFGYRARGAEPCETSWIARIHPEDSPAVMKDIQSVTDGAGHLWSGEYRFQRADGEYAHVFDRGYVLRDEAGRPVRMIGAIQDITDRRRAEAELNAAHRDLVEASRRAGQAEVATSVLHNVGNVLNSVIVSATLAIDRTRELRLNNVALTADLLRENRPTLGPFFETHPKGRMLIDYLPQLARSLEKERGTVVTELGMVVKHIEHIKEIITTQQNFAKSVGVFETVPFTELIEQAIALNADSLARHQVTLVREFTEVPPFPVDRHRVVQILVNLIRNAKDALKAGAPPADRRLAIEMSPTGAGMVQVRVVDNGIGIAPENLTRIFQHGFTTRRDGHGFGLHSGALTARQLGGRLCVASEGRGRGAAFVLELPIQKSSS